MALCECGCGETVTGWNPNTGQPVRFRKGHWTRIHGDRIRAAHEARRLAARVPQAQLEELLEELGSVAAVARRLHRAPTTVSNWVREYGIGWTPHANALEGAKIEFAWAAEEHAAYLLGAELVRPLCTRDAPFDLLWDGQRVNVKAARPTKGRTRGSRCWQFNVGRGRSTCDLFFLIACAPSGMPVRYLLVPAERVPKSQVQVPTNLRGVWMEYLWRPGEAA